MKAVIDVGCATYHGQHHSVERLIEMYRPNALYGFDPNPREPWQPPGETVPVGWPVATHIYIEQRAAWIYDGYIGFVSNGLGSHVVAETESSAVVPCFDLSGFIRQLAEDEIILKIDAEGAEYPLLDYLIAEETDQLLSLVLVEWHDNIEAHAARRKRIENQIHCPLEEWPW